MCEMKNMVNRIVIVDANGRSSSKVRRIVPSHDKIDEDDEEEEDDCCLILDFDLLVAEEGM